MGNPSVGTGSDYVKNLLKIQHGALGLEIIAYLCISFNNKLLSKNEK